MEAVLKSWKKEELQQECMKNGMAISGNKEMLIKRIMKNIPGKCKPGPKPKAGIAKKATSAKVTSAIKTFPIQLEKKHMESLGLYNVGEDEDANGNTVFKYAKLNPCAFKLNPCAFKPPAAAMGTKQYSSKPPCKPRSSSDNDDDTASESGSERSDDLMNNDTFQEYKSNLASRLGTERMPKKLLVKLIKVYDPNQDLSGVDKPGLAERLVEQLMYETDEEEDE